MSDFDILIPGESEYKNPLTVMPEKFYNTSSELCNCLEPEFVLNPQVNELIHMHKNYTLNGKFHKCSGRLYPHFKMFFAPGRKVDLETVQNSYITDLDTGEIFPIYMIIPCGHCEICRSKKVNSFAHRCLLETQMYPYRPFFITLTYSDRYLPKDGVRVEHVQGFLKRLRARFDYYGIDLKIRYVAVSQYGYNTHRAHYHLIVWNLPNWKFWRVAAQCRLAWRKGHVYVSQISNTYVVKGTKHLLSKPEKCFEYVARYICNDSVVPLGCRNTFMTTSKRNGGIGAPFLDRHMKYIRSHRISNFFFLDKFSQTKRKLVFCRYVVNRLYPSYSMSVPLELRKAVRIVTRFAWIVKDGPRLLDKIRPVLKPHFVWSEVYPYDWQRFTHNYRYTAPSWVRCRSCPFMIRGFWMLARTIFKYLDFDFDSSHKLHSDRVYVLGKLTQQKHVRDLYLHAHQLRKSRHLAYQRELL